MAIVGEPFDEYVSKQINDRQKIHGQGFTQNRDNLTLSYLNSRTGWIKLSSGVVVVDGAEEKLESLEPSLHPSFFGPSNLKGQTGLSSFFVLFNGTSDNSGTPYGGIDIINGQPHQDVGQSILNKVAYGIGGTEFGFKPMPGITSIETKFRNRGSIKESTINIKAYNRTQLEIIDVLYLRLGFPMLLEWGHSIIVDENGKIDTKPDFSLSSKFLGLTYKTDNEVLAAIEEQRKKSAGNYDGMYGRVVNFDWTFNKDGFYDITLKLISVGAVIESLKANVYIKDNTPENSTKSADEQKLNPESDAEWITASKYSHTIGNYFFQFYKKPKQTDRGISFCKIEDTVFIRGGTDKDFIYVEGLNKYYIRLGAFWSLLQQIVPVLNLNNQTTSPLMYFYPSGVTNNPAYTEKYQVSSDLNVCLIGGFDIASFYGYKTSYSIIPQLPSFKDDTNTKGKIENIYVNTTLILQSLNNNKNENGDTKLFDFIQNILNSINVALGGVNSLTLIVDENNNNAEIIDENFNITVDQKESPLLNVYGYYNNQTTAGFIRDVSLKTEITNDMMTMITVGATANKSVVGEDATMFSKWNKGLEPIIGPKTSYPNGESSNLQQTIIQFQRENQQLIDFYKNWLDYQTIVPPDPSSPSNIGKGSAAFSSPKIDSNNLSNYTDVVKNFINFNKEYNLRSPNNKGKVTSTSSKGFFPLNLSLTMDGLSGIKIYQQLKIDTSYLPKNYPTSLRFIIKGVTHKINNSGWSTSIETISVPINDTLIEDLYNSDTPSVSAAPAKRAEDRNFPNANNLRKTLSQLGYKEKGNEIDNGGADINEQIEKAASAVLKTIKQEIPFAQITVTGGNDKYHQGLGSNSRHKAGNAIDFTILPQDSTTLDKVVNILQRYSAGNYPNFRFIDEYRNLTEDGTGNHFHISWGVGSESQKEINKSLQLAQQGKIIPIKIA